MTINAQMNKTLMPISLNLKYYQLEELAKFLSSDSVKTIRVDNVTLDIISSDVSTEFEKIKVKVEAL